MKSILRAALAALVLVPSFLYAQTAPTGSFTLATQINANGTLTPTLTWSTTPAATSCAASGDSAWAGSKAASGTQTLAAFPATTPKAYALVCNWPGDTQALLTWTPPTQFAPVDHDNNPATPDQPGGAMAQCSGPTNTWGACLSGYRVHWGTAAAALTQSANVNNPGAVGYTVTGLSPNTYFFAVRALTGFGAESVLSNTISKTVTPPVQWTQSTGVKIPMAPVLE